MSDASLAELIDELTGRLQAGEALDEAAVLRRHPRFADDLRALFPTLRALGELSESGEPTPRTAAPGGRLGDFRLIREVGRGGGGVVYEAEQASLRRRVALKVMPLSRLLDPRLMGRFQDEARAAAALRHENIVPVFAVGFERGLHYRAMQFIDGRSLAAMIRGAAHDARQAAGFAVLAADALAHAHAQGVVHGAVTPANMLVDAAGKLWVTEFGLGRDLADHRADIRGLGATLRELLRGASRSPRDLETIVRAALSQHPAEGYPSAGEMAADLRRFLAGQPVTARRPSAIRRLLRWLRRDPPIIL